MGLEAAGLLALHKPTSMPAKRLTLVGQYVICLLACPLQGMPAANSDVILVGQALRLSQTTGAWLRALDDASQAAHIADSPATISTTGITTKQPPYAKFPRVCTQASLSGNCTLECISQAFY